MTTNHLTEEQFNAETAGELVVISHDATGAASISFHDENYILDDVDRNLAIALAERLLHLAQSLPDPPRILRRSSDVDTHLRALDD